MIYLHKVMKLEPFLKKHTFIYQMTLFMEMGKYQYSNNQSQCI